MDELWQCRICKSFVTRQKILGPCRVCKRRVCTYCHRICDRCQQIVCMEDIEARKVAINGAAMWMKVCEYCKGLV